MDYFAVLLAPQAITNDVKLTVIDTTEGVNTDKLWFMIPLITVKYISLEKTQYPPTYLDKKVYLGYSFTVEVGR